MATRKTYVTIVIGAIVALTPPILLYLQSRAELREKYHESNAEADAGYKALVDSVRELRATVQVQHDAITKIQGYLEAMQRFSPSLRMSTPPPQLPKPSFHDLPADLDEAKAEAKK